MDLLVLGSSASVPAPGNACSGYLVRNGDTEILIDCGTGVLANLLGQTTLDRLSAIVISHFHPDHYLDLVPMRYALRYGTTVARPPLFVPPGGAAFLENLGMALRGKAGFFAESFVVNEYDPASALAIGSLSLRFCRTTHDEPTWAMAVQGNSRLVYTADTEWSDDVLAFARGADILLSEATFPANSTQKTSNHLTTHQAGILGRKAGVGSLVLTHAWPGYDREEMSAEAARAYGAEVVTATPLLRIPVRGSAVTATPK